MPSRLTARGGSPKEEFPLSLPENDINCQDKSIFMAFPRRMAIFVICLALVIVALAGCLGGDDGSGGDNGGDTGDQAADMILKEGDMPSGWYSSLSGENGFEFPSLEGDFGSLAITYFSDDENLSDATEWLIVAVLDFDDVAEADSWYDNSKGDIIEVSNTNPLDVGDEGVYEDVNADGTDIKLVFRNEDVCVYMNYLTTGTPLGLNEVIDLAELQNDKL